jgi:predicted translin family RNA/ssDNA-binding protein
MNWETEVDLNPAEKEEILRQARELQKDSGEEIAKIHVWTDSDGYLSFQPYFTRKIKRIRRITGYFSRVENFNDAKKAELYDRVVHM